MKPTRVTQKDFLFLTISFFVLVILWVGSNIYHAYVDSTIAEDLQLKITPIDGKFDTQTLNALKERPAVEPFFTIPVTVEDDSASEEATLTPDITTPSPSVTIIPDDEFNATPSGTETTTESQSTP